MEPGAVMSPFYTFSYPLQLSEDDKRGIQSLYGSKHSDDRGKKEERPPNFPETNEIESAVVSYMADSVWSWESWESFSFSLYFFFSYLPSLMLAKLTLMLYPWSEASCFSLRRVMCGGSVMVNSRMDIQHWHPGTGEESQAKLMLLLRTSLAISGFSKVNCLKINKMYKSFGWVRFFLCVKLLKHVWLQERSGNDPNK